VSAFRAAHFTRVVCVAAVVAASITAAGARSGGAAEDGSGLGFSFENVAREAGINHVTVFGGSEANKYLLETTGTGVAFIDYDDDGWLDLFFVNGTTLEGFPADKAPINHL